MEFSDAFLDEVGLADLPPSLRPRYLASFRLRLVVAVAREVVPRLGSSELDACATVASIGDPALLVVWLESNVAGFRALVAREFATLSAQIREDAPAMLALEALAEVDEMRGPWPGDASKGP